MRETKLSKIGYELSVLWDYLSRQELCEYFDIAVRTLYDYKTKLKLKEKAPQKMQDLKKIYNTPNSLSIYLNDDNKLKKLTFKNWEHFAIWNKAQSNPIVIDSKIIKGKNAIVCKHSEQEKAESVKFKKALKLC